MEGLRVELNVAQENEVAASQPPTRISSVFSSRALEMKDASATETADLSSCTNWLHIASMALERTKWHEDPKPAPIKANEMGEITRGSIDFRRFPKEDTTLANTFIEAFLRCPQTVTIATDGSHNPNTRILAGVATL